MARGEIIVRADAHGTYDERYVSEIVRVLCEVEKAGAAEGPMYVSMEQAKKSMAKAIAVAHCSKFGIGAGKFHDPAAEGWADAGWLGGYWRQLLLQAGGFRAELLRTEDIDLYARLRALGYGLYLSPKIKAYYTPRTTLRELWRQNFANGMGVMQTLFVNHQALSLRHLVPLAFAVNLLGGLLLTPLWWPGKVWLALVAVPYLVGTVFFSLYDGSRHCPPCIPLMPVVFATVHLSYGLGSIWGLLRSSYRKIRFGDVNIFGVNA